MKICVVGTGYVGLVAGTCFAESGNDVVGVDIDERKLAMLRENRSPIYEPGLEELLRRNQREGRLGFTNDLADAVRKSTICFIAVGTPERPDGAADLEGFFTVVRGIGEAMDGYRVIVNKSTVPIGTADRTRRVVAEVTSQEFDVVSNPEFMKEGAAIEDFLKPDRVVIGSDSARANDLMGELYEPFMRTDNRLLVMDTRSAELTKYAANALLATRISFMNEVANLCERVGADVNLVRRGIGSDRRIGPAYLFPGVGYGGSCFPKDVTAMIHTAEEYGLDASLLRSVDVVNDRQKHVLVQKVKNHFGSDLAGRTFAIWGLSFKPRTDDMREASALTIVEGLLAAGARVRGHDPEALGEAQRRLGGPDRVLRPKLRRPRGGRCASHRHRMERVPPPRLSPDEGGSPGASHLRRPKPLRPRGDARARIRLSLRRTPPGGGCLMSRMMVTGGAGFIGSHLCERFLADGHEVICVDNLLTGSADNIAHLFGHKGFSFLEIDVTEYIYVSGPLDAILHFASPASPVDYLELPIQTLKVGSLGTHNVLGLAKEKGARFLLASTSEVYGDPLVHPQPEEYWGNVNPIGPRGVYDEAKRFAEAITMAYHRTHGVDTRIVRIFNTFGPRMRERDGRVVPNFIQQALQAEPMTVYGDGAQTRSFCYACDLVEGIVRLLASTRSEPVNIGNPQEMTVLDFAKAIRHLTGSRSEIVFEPLPVDDPKVRQPDISVARSLLGWEPRVALEEGLRKTIEYFRGRMKA